MLVSRYGNWFVAQAPAKINLFLEVLARRADGYHEIETLLVALDRCDTLALCACDSPEIELECRWVAGLDRGVGVSPAKDGESVVGELPQSDDNLAVRAVRLLRRKANVERGAKMQLIKRIPAAAGLGGASSDAAAALLVANAAWELNWPRERLAEVAAEIGSDVPFFLHGGAAIARGRGEKLQQLERFPALHVVVARPPVGLSTPAVYKRCQPARDARQASGMVDAARKRDANGIAATLHNQLQPAAEQLTPWIARMAAWLDEADVLGHQMSGSGSSYFAICRSAAQARRIANRAAAALSPSLVFAARTMVGEAA